MVSLSEFWSTTFVMGPRYKSRLLEFEELFEDTGKGSCDDE